MNVMQTLRRTWNQTLHFFSSAEEEELLASLREQYGTAIRDIVQLSAHAGRMYYPQFHDRLLSLIAERRDHARWLRKQILTLGGTLPEVEVAPKIGRNSWECFLLDLEDKKQNSADLVNQIHLALRVNPNIANELLRIRADEQRQHEELRAMWMRSDPDIPPAPKADDHADEERKEEWLTQQKLKWRERQRSQWEADGKFPPWEEWQGELEYRWVVNELPTLELAWTRRRAEAEQREEERSLHRTVKPS